MEDTRYKIQDTRIFILRVQKRVLFGGSRKYNTRISNGANFISAIRYTSYNTAVLSPVSMFSGSGCRKSSQFAATYSTVFWKSKDLFVGMNIQSRSSLIHGCSFLRGV